MATPNKHGLGRGLGALIPAKAAPEGHAQSGVRQVPIGHIEPNPLQPRKRFAAHALDELAASVREHGLIQPLLLKEYPTAHGLRYQLIAGERRWRAAQRAGLTMVPALVKGVTPQQMLELALVENVQRADLNALEEAEAYRQLMEEFKLTQEQVAKKVGKNRSTVSNALRLLQMPDELKQALVNQEISEGHARALLQLTEPKQQKQYLKKILEKGLSVRDTEELVRRSVTPKTETPRATGSPADSEFRARPPAIARQEMHIENQALEDEMRRALGTNVKLQRSNSGGKLIIEFYSDEEFDVIYKKLVNQ